MKIQNYIYSLICIITTPAFLFGMQQYKGDKLSATTQTQPAETQLSQIVLEIFTPETDEKKDPGKQTQQITRLTDSEKKQLFDLQLCPSKLPFVEEMLKILKTAESTLRRRNETPNALSQAINALYASKKTQELLEEKLTTTNTLLSYKEIDNIRQNLLDLKNAPIELKSVADEHPEIFSQDNFISLGEGSKDLAMAQQHMFAALLARDTTTWYQRAKQTLRTSTMNAYKTCQNVSKDSCKQFIHNTLRPWTWKNTKAVKVTYWCNTFTFACLIAARAALQYNNDLAVAILTAFGLSASAATAFITAVQRYGTPRPQSAQFPVETARFNIETVAGYTLMNAWNLSGIGK